MSGRDVVKILLGIATFLGSLAFLAIFLTPGWSWAIMISLGLHELAHWVAFRWIGTPAKIYFVGPIGAVTVADRREPVMQATDWQEFVLSFSGPLVNVLLAIGGFAWQSGHSTTHTGTIFAGMNLALAVWNLIPLGPVDGAKAFQAIFESLDEDDDYRLATFMNVLSGLAGGFLAAQGYWPFAIVLGMVFVFRAAGLEDPHAHRHHTAMPRRQALALGALMVMVLVGAAVTSYFVPLDLGVMLK